MDLKRVGGGDNDWGMEPKRRRVVDGCEDGRGYIVGRKRRAGNTTGMNSKRHHLMLGEGCFNKPFGIDDDDDTFSPEEYIHLYTTIGNMSAYKPSQGLGASDCLYTCYRKDLENHLKSKVSPSLKQKQGEILLRALVNAWDRFKRMTTWLIEMFHCLTNSVCDQFFAKLSEISCTCFMDVVFHELQKKVTKIIVHMIHDERENVPINGTVIKNVADMFVEVKLGQLDFYEAHFEKMLLESTSEYYSKKARSWILDDSCQQYMAKVELCLEDEKQRATRYMHSSSKLKILQVVKVEMIHNFADKILKDDISGFHVLLRNEKVDCLLRMFVLFAASADALIHLSKLFKEHILEEVTSVQKEATDAACRLNDKFSDWLMQEFVYKVIKLHDKYSGCVGKCFQGHPMFKKALEEAFQGVCNEDIVDRNIADIFSTFCADMLRKTGREMGINEPAEEIVEKVVKLLAYLNSKDLFLQLHRKKLEMRQPIDLKIEIAFLLKLRQCFGAQYNFYIDEIVKYLTAESNQVSAVKLKLLGGVDCGPVQSDAVHYQVLDEYLNSAKVVSVDASTQLAFNQLVQEYFTPVHAGLKRNAKYTLEGYSIFGGLLSHITNAHTRNKSWNGQITLKMFFVIQGQIHMFPWAWNLARACSADSCLQDLTATVALILAASKLTTPNGVVEPLHLKSLGAYLKTVQRGSTLGSKLRTFVRCNPAFASHSQKSCFCWHIRRFEVSIDRRVQQQFRSTLETNASIKDWRKNISNNPLFKDTFVKAAKMNSAYGPGPRELNRFIRDWHTHCHQNFTEAMKIRYSFHILEEVAEAYFNDYFQEIFFKVLMAGYDIDAWLSNLKPALPMYKEISKGG